MIEKERLEWTLLDRIVRESFSEEVTCEQRPECPGKKTFNVERLTTPVAFSGIKLGMFKENNKIQVYEQGWNKQCVNELESNMIN